MKVSEELHLLLTMLCRATDLPGPSVELDVRPSGARDPWQHWWQLVDEHQLTAFLGGRPDLLEAYSVPAQLSDALIAAHVRGGHEGLFRHWELVRVCNKLASRAPVIALKGAAISYSLYPLLADRAMSDLDLLLIDRTQLATARVALLSDGYRTAGEELPEHHHAAPLSDSIAELTIELHTDLTHPALPEGALDELIRRRVEWPSVPGLTMLDPIGRLVHHAIHAVHDPIDSPLLRNLFEVAWMAQKFTLYERRDLAAFTEKYGLTDQVGHALALAGELFGAPVLLPLPEEGPIEYWCKQRLEWTDSHGDADWWSRFRRELAERHLKEQRSESSVPLLRAGAEGIRRAASSRISSFFSRAQEIEPVPLQTTPVGDGLLAWDPASGEVHFLSALSAAIWCAAEEEHDPKKLEVLLDADGVTPEITRAALETLLQSGLVRTRERL